MLHIKILAYIEEYFTLKKMSHEVSQKYIQTRGPLYSVTDHLVFYFTSICLNELSTNSNASHLGWRIDCDSGKQDFESEPGKNHFSSYFWIEDFNMILVF